MSVLIIDRLENKLKTLVSINKTAYKFFSNKHVRKFTNTLSKEGSLLPVVLLEASVIAGRTYHANKRGGKVEARERFREESLAAVVWLWGMKTFNKAYDFAAKSLGMKHIGVDLGKDAVRNPLESFFKKNPKLNKTAFSVAKSAKVILSAGLTIWAVGDLIPKYIHKMTAKRLSSEASEIKEASKKAHETEENTNNTQGNNFLGHTSLREQKRTSIQEFLNNAKNKNISFTSSGGFVQGLTQFAFNLETKNIFQLLTVDVGLTSGRGINARNKDERREIIFRDGASAIFYSLSTPFIAKVLSLLDPFQAKNTKLDTETVDFVHNHILKNTAIENNKISIDEFRQKLFGKDHPKAEDIIKQVEKAVTNSPDNSKQYAISLDKFQEILAKEVSKEELETIMQRAKGMSKMQPEHPSLGKILSKTQVKDALSDGLLKDAKFLKEALEINLEKPKLIKFLAKETKETLDNPEIYIPQNKIDQARGYIMDYAETIFESAQKKGAHEIDVDIMNSMKVRNTKYKLIYTAVGMGISALFLSSIIPKLQYLMTERRTGKNAFPGVTNYNG